MRLTPERAIWLGGTLSIVLVSLWVRGLLPIDETRYVGVAWEMWLRGDWLVPHKNGLPYSHKPPFLFWMINLGWWLFGVSEWWPRLMPSLFALVSLFLIIRLARLLRPDQPVAHELAPLILFSSFLWTLFSTMTMFDTILSFWVLLAVIAVVQAALKSGWGSWLLLGFALGGGLLSKGPVILLQVLPLALLAPFWLQREQQWGRWYIGILLSVLLGAIMILAWAVPAGLSGGDQYFNEIFWGQTANRMVESFAHRRAWWWYLPLLPVLLFPWLFWTSMWRKPAIGQNQQGIRAGRFLLAWVVPVFVAFSLISGKQPHYLLPLFPAFAIWLALDAEHGQGNRKTRRNWLLAVVYVLIAAAWLVQLVIKRDQVLPEWLQYFPQWPILVFVLLAVMVMLPWARRSLRAQARVMALSSIIFTLVLLLSAMKTLYSPAFDVQEVATRIARLQAQGHSVAVLGKYHNQFQFKGRLTQAIEIVEWASIHLWIKERDPAWIVLVLKKRHELDYREDEYIQPYRGKWIALLRRGTLQEHPELARQ